jgi:hypothetical protein
MMPALSLCTLTYDPFANLELELNATGEGLLDRGRRVTRTPTIDGGAVVEDFGLSHADRTWTVRAKASRGQAEILRYLVEAYGEIRAVTREGVFRVAPDTLQETTAPLVSLRLLVLRKEG